VIHEPVLLLFAFIPMLIYCYDVYHRGYNWKYFEVDAVFTSVGGEDNRNESTYTAVTIPLSSVANESHRDNFESYYPGQYYMLTIPSISNAETHPFSLTSPTISHERNSQQSVSFLVRNMHLNTWTSRLFNLAHRKIDSSLTKVRLDGPFGSAFRYLTNHSTVVLVCGGIGITPALSFIQDFILRRYDPATIPVGSGHGRDTRWRCVENIHLVWVSRDETLFEYQKDLLLKFEESKINDTNDISNGDEKATVAYPRVQLFNTAAIYQGQAEKKIDVNSNITVQFSRPDFDQVFHLALFAGDLDVNKTAGVMVCGPSALVDSVKKAVTQNQMLKRRIEVFTEVFQF
jgi:NAD(P)H-flavin reductase